MSEPAGYTRSRIAARVDAALERAGALGVLPTPLDAVRAALGIGAPEPIETLPFADGGRRLLGAYWFEARATYVEPGQSPARRRFTEAHELAHALCPWHEAALRVDTSAELFGAASAGIEAEANLGAGLLIFQGREFKRRVAEAPRSLAAALELAEMHAASAHATLRHYVEMHPSALALLVLGRFALKAGGLPVWRSVESPAFAARFGALRSRLGAIVRPGGGLHELAEAARGAGLASASLSLPDLTGHPRRVRAEGYYNRHSLLLLVAAPDAP